MRRSAAPGLMTMMTLVHSFVLQGDALTGGTSANASPSGTLRGSHLLARAFFFSGRRGGRAMLGSTVDTYSASA